MRRLLKRLLDRASRLLDSKPMGNEALIERLRSRGVRIGEGCVIHTESFSTEPYLISLGDRVAIAGGTKFVTHDGSVWLMRRERPAVQTFGTITVGSDTFIGENCIILANTSIGAHCIVGAGSVLRGQIADNSLVVGNPAAVVGRASLVVELLKESKDTMDSLTLGYEERRDRLLRHFGLPR
ncbi:MAG TPA: acyltransferase [Candidatus Bathyarchaeia archaeon]|nr:acyltransferase [Candidatus Bathyarchaeia archaeon]